MFINKSWILNGGYRYENRSDPYNELSELSHKLNLELIAKNIDLRISLK